jgi:hypothetical protein
MFDRLFLIPGFKRAFEVWKKYEHWFGSAALLTGFCFDLVFANRPDSAANNILLLTYLLMAGGLIIVLNIQKTRRMLDEHPVEPIFLLTLLQFLFGNLSSNLLVLYGRSGTFAGSAIFLILLFGMLLGNEFLKTSYGQLRFNIAVYYLLVFSYLMIAVPTFIFHDIGVLVFLATGLFSLVFIGLFLSAVYRFILRGRYRKRQLLEVGVYIAGVFFAFNIFYFLNIIPPVPLSLKEVGIYHSITSTSGGYEATYEAPWWFAFWRGTSPTYHLGEGSTAYCFSAIFAPTGLSTPVEHEWEFYNEATRQWEVRSRFTFAISGGRAEGYRGFSSKTVSAGKWRCNVETAGGALIGRTDFTATAVTPSKSLTSKTL